MKETPVFRKITASAEETRNVGKLLSRELREGDVVVLSGDLGAGKSEFSRGVARGLGITGPVPSPSFTILNTYDQLSVPLYHFDWYRIGDPQELYDIGLDEFIGGDGIALIEWSERAEEAVPETHLRVEIHKIDDDTREIVFFSQGNFHDIQMKEG